MIACSATSAFSAVAFPSSTHAIGGDAETEAESLVLRRVRVAEAAARAVGVEVPAAAADHARGALGRTVRIDVGRRRLAVQPVPVGRPFPDVAVHVAEAPWVQREAAGRGCLLTELARWNRGVREPAVGVGLRGGEILAGRARS